MADKTFYGRVLCSGEITGEALVTHGGLNTLATFQKSALKNAKEIIGSDQNNPDLYGKVITGKILCLPNTIGSTTGGMVLQTVCSMKLNPSAMLFANEIDSLAASGVILAKYWENSTMIAIDKLGKEFLDYVKTGDTIQIKLDGTVIVKRM
ncbi:MAG: DUF126 domain-containing protein [Clostridia bacterium]|nr:DUF126 domain-containing protein [Clostridia bacterium]